MEANSGPVVTSRVKCKRWNIKRRVHTSVSMVAAEILNLGKGAQMGKMDTQQAYQNILVDPKDRRLLGMLWQGNVYIDAVLPFGIHSAPLIS